MIRDFVAALPEEDAGRPIALMSYSKGAPDILEAVVAVARSHPLVGGTVINRNDYPREALVEVLLRYLDEAL